MKRNAILIWIAAALLGCGLIYRMLTIKSSLNQAIDKLDNSEHKIDSAISCINQARSEIRNLQKQTDSFQSYTGQITASVRELNAGMTASNNAFRLSMLDINRSIIQIRDSIKNITPDSFPPDIPGGILKNGMDK